uniref:Putative secreted protein n=1 Tax=Panstrongylus lignarius TaxID=156445 RepID=A0A224XRA6_9HEMI
MSTTTAQSSIFIVVFASWTTFFTVGCRSCTRCYGHTLSTCYSRAYRTLKLPSFTLISTRSTWFACSSALVVVSAHRASHTLRCHDYLSHWTGII